MFGERIIWKKAQLTDLPENVEITKIFIFVENKSLMLEANIKYHIKILFIKLAPGGSITVDINQREVSKIDLPWYLSFLENKAKQEINNRIDL